jgi:Holliday junction DNA helicase RuvB
MSDRIMDPGGQDSDAYDGHTFRPRRFEDFIGQDKVKAQLTIAIEAAKSRGEVLEHVLLSGPPGLGKSTLSTIIAHEMDVGIRTTVGPILVQKMDLAAILSNLQPGDVLFIDEIHRTRSEIQEMLYPAMEDYRLDIIIGQGPSARTVPIPLPKYTLVGATTRMGQLSAPFRDRFGLNLRLDFYDVDQLSEIIARDSKLFDVEITGDADRIIASRSRGTPRVAKRMHRRIRDFVKVRKDGVITPEAALEALEFYEVDELGLEEMDRAILLAIIEKFSGGPVGLGTIAISVNEEDRTIEDAHEPYLIQAGFISRTPRGRIVTKRAYEHLGLTPPASTTQQPDFWDKE